MRYRSQRMISSGMWESYKCKSEVRYLEFPSAIGKRWHDEDGMAGEFSLGVSSQLFFYFSEQIKGAIIIFLNSRSLKKQNKKTPNDILD